MRSPSLVLLVCAAACSPALDLGTDSVITCDARAICPESLVCVLGGRCVDPALVDTLGARTYAPAPDEIVSGALPVEMLWGVVTGAAEYTLEVATDEAMTAIVASQKQAGVRTTLPLSAGTYYWRVRSDVSNGLTAAPSRFGVIGDAVHVYCSSVEACSTEGGVQLGTATHPMMSIAGGMAVASRLGVHDVRVAHRIGRQPYDEQIAVVAGLNLHGGYDPTFAMVDGRTAVASTRRVLSAFEVRSPTIIEGFALTRSAGEEASSDVALLYECSDSLLVRDTTFEAPLWRTGVLRVEESVNSGPVLRDSSVTGSMSAAAGGVTSSLVELTNRGAVRLERVMLTGDSVDGSASIEGVSSDGGALTVVGGAIELDGARNAVGIRVSDGEHTHVEDVRIDVRGSTDSVAGVSSSSAPMSVIRSTIYAHGSPSVGGMYLVELGGEAGASVIASNVILAVASDTLTLTSRADGISITGSNVVVVGNTILVGGAADGDVGVGFVASTPRLLNNLIVSVTPRCSASRCRSALLAGGVDAENTYPPAAVLSNAFVGFGACDYRVLVNNGGRDDCLVANAARTEHGYTTVAGGNVAYAAASAAGLPTFVGADGVFATADDDYYPIAGAAIAGRGADTGANTCVPSPLPPRADFAYPRLLAIPEPSCGGAFSAWDGRVRATPATIGALEAR